MVIIDHSNIGFDYQYYKLFIRLRISIINYRTALVYSQRVPITIFNSTASKTIAPYDD
jgi:hypothetical protein